MEFQLTIHDCELGFVSIAPSQGCVDTIVDSLLARVTVMILDRSGLLADLDLLTYFLELVQDFVYFLEQLDVTEDFKFGFFR